MILQNILKYRNDSNVAQTLLSTIKSSGANPPEKFFFLIMLLDIQDSMLKKLVGAAKTCHSHLPFHPLPIYTMT